MAPQPYRAKRLLDIVVAAPALVLASPLLAVVILAIRLTSAGPGIYSQLRLGKDALPFRCHKLRTMVSGTPSAPTHETSQGYITPVGRVLRRLKIDEIPQLLNVLKGEMSLVGPRPCLPEQDVLIAERRRLDVFQLMPGITGRAQVGRIDMSDPLECARADADYLAQVSLSEDIRILLRTFF